MKISSQFPLYELEYFRCPTPLNSDSMDISVVVNDSITSELHAKRTIIVDELPESRRIRFTEHLGSFGAQFAIEFFKHTINIVVNKVVSVSRHVVYVNLVEPILRFVLVARGYLLLHCACVVDSNGEGFLLSAPPDTGKTTTVLKCIKRGLSFLSDDMTILHLPNQAMCFPKPMTISAHTFKTATDVSDNEDGYNKSSLKIRGLVHSKRGRQFMRRLGTYNVPIFTINAIGQKIVKPPKFRVEDLMQEVKIQPKSNVRNLYFLEKGGEELLSISPDMASRKAIENSDDAFLFPPYAEMLKYFRIDGNSSSDLLLQERNMLDNYLANVNCSVIKSDNRSWFQTLIGRTSRAIN